MLRVILSKEVNNGKQSCIPKADDIRAVGNRVIVSDMEFGEQVTRGGIIHPSDDGTRGIYPKMG